MHVTGARGECDCPACGTPSSRIHSRYERTVGDLPVQGTRATLLITARKYYCDESSCDRKIFCERFPGVLEAYARRTVRLEGIVTNLALMVSACLAARLSRLLRFPCSASTLLRCANRFEPPEVVAPRIGVDDFAFRRGQQYGTIIIDLDTHRPIDVLPDRSSQTLRGYLARHREVNTICRDRDARYAEAITWEAPDATVVLDRWHLLRNLTDAFERHVARNHRSWTTALREHARHAQEQAALDADSTPYEAWVTAPPGEVTPRELERRLASRQCRQERYDRIAELHAHGLSKTQIAQRLALDRGTVAAYLQNGGPPSDKRRRFAPTLLDPYLPYLADRWRGGCRNAALLTRELREKGYTGSVRTVLRRIRAWRRQAPDPTAAGPALPTRLPAPRTLAWNLLQGRHDDATELLLDLVPAVPAAEELARDGFEALRAKNLDAWATWRREVMTSDMPDLKRFVRGLDRDGDAVTNAFLSPYSNGPTEGNVHRIKLIKRTMYGRASFQLLRKKILYQPA